MAQRSKTNNNPFRVAPTVAPKKPVSIPSEDDKKPEATKPAATDPGKRTTINVTDNTDNEPAKKTKQEKVKKKPGRKQTVEGGATERLVVMLNKETSEKFAKYCKERRYSQSELLREVIIKMISEKK